MNSLILFSQLLNHKDIEIQGITAEMLNQFVAIAKKTNLKKGTFLVKSSEIPQYIYIMGNNSFAREFIEQDGQHLTSEILTPNDIVYNYAGYKDKTTYCCNIQMLTNSVVWRISIKDYLSLKEKNPLFREIELMIISLYLKQSKRQSNELRFLSAKDRYFALLKSRPHIIQNVASIYIAQYLGVSAECLSRIRSNVKAFQNII